MSGGAGRSSRKRNYGPGSKIRAHLGPPEYVDEILEICWKVRCYMVTLMRIAEDVMKRTRLLWLRRKMLEVAQIAAEVDALMCTVMAYLDPRLHGILPLPGEDLKDEDYNRACPVFEENANPEENGGILLLIPPEWKRRNMALSRSDNGHHKGDTTD